MFVPVAFIPGISGELFRQFAVTVSVSMVLSAINALTLSPALCAILLRPHHGPRRGPIGALMRGIDWVRDGYGAIVARLVHMSIIGLVRVAVALVGVVGLGKITPTGFLPEDDQGAFFVIMRIARRRFDRARTTDVMRQVENILKPEARDPRLHCDNRAELHRQLLAAQRCLFDRLAEAICQSEPRRSDSAQAMIAGSLRSSARCAAGAAFRLRHHRSSASAPVAGSAMCCRTPVAAARKPSRRSCVDC